MNLAPIPIGPPLYTTDFGAIGDGVADDTLALNNAFQAAQTRKLIIVQGKYRTTSPLVVYDHSNIEGATNPETGGGNDEVLIAPDKSFDLSGDFPRCVIENYSYATGSRRCAALSLQNITVDCSAINGVSCFGLHDLDEHCWFHQLSAMNGQSGFLLTGTATGETFGKISAWSNKEGGVRITSHVAYSPLNSTGSYHFLHISGDQNINGLLLIEGTAMAIKVGFMKSEIPPIADDSAVRFRPNPQWRNKGIAAMGQSRVKLDIFGNFAGIIPDGSQAACAIYLDSEGPVNEAPRPSIRYGGHLGGYQHWIGNTLNGEFSGDSTTAFGQYDAP